MALGEAFLTTKFPTNKELEKTARETGTLAVYADWLQAQGSPLGEYIALAAALEGGADPKKQKRLEALAEQLALPTKGFATWKTKHGFFRSLRLENSEDWMDGEFEAVAFAKRLFATPLCAALEELAIGVLRWDHNHTDVPQVLDAAGGFAWAKGLARLHLGDVEQVDTAHHVVGEVGGVISLAFPGLRSLHVHSGSQHWRDAGETFSLAGLALPKLESLTVETCAMTSERAKSLMTAKLPKLTELELWFGGSEDDAGATVEDLAPLLDGKVLQSVTHLGLCNLDFGTELVARLVNAPVAKRITSLDLSKSTLDASNIPALRALAEALPNLTEIDVNENFFSEEDLAALGDRFLSDTQKELDDDYRYVSVRE